MPHQYTTKDERRFWSKVDKAGPGGCWLWTGTLSSKGYGQFQMRNKSRAAHRIAWELANGPIPEGLQVCHECDVRNCVNPAHLFLGTQLDNMRDMFQKGRARVGRPRKKNQPLTSHPWPESKVATVMKFDRDTRYGWSATFFDPDAPF